MQFKSQVSIVTLAGTPPLAVSVTDQVINLNSQYAGNLIGGSAGGLPYQTAANTTSIISIGASNSVLTSSGTAPQWSTSLALAGNLSLSGVTSLISINGNGSGGSQFQIPGGGNSMFSVLSSSGQVYLGANLYHNGSAWVQSAYGGSTNSSLLGFVPGTGAQWWASSNSAASFNVASAVLLWDSVGSWRGTLNAASGAQVNGSNILTAAAGTAVSATNIAGGSAGSLPYQTGAGASTFLSIGSASNVLTAGASAPQWTAQSSLSVGSSNISTNISGGAVGDLLYQSAGATTAKLGIGATGSVLQSSGTIPTWSTLASLTVGAATNLSAGAAGSLHYQSGVGTSAFLSIGTAAQVLTVNGAATAPQWVAQSTLSVGSATAATNISAGSAGDLLYQSAAATTAKLGIGATSTILQSTGSAPTWSTLASLTVGAATNATNIVGGSAGDLLYQSAGSTTSKLGVGTGGYDVRSNGSLPVYEKTKYTASFGDGYATTFTFTHGIVRGGSAQTNVLVQIIRNSDGLISTFASTVTAIPNSGSPQVVLTFALAPASAQYTVVIMG